MAINAAIPDITHQMHAHGIATKGKEGAVTKAEYTRITPGKINRKCQDRVANPFARHSHNKIRNAQRMARRQRIQQRRQQKQHKNQRYQRDAQIEAKGRNTRHGH